MERAKLKTLIVGGLGFIGRHIIRSSAQSSLVLVSTADSVIRNKSFVDRLGLVAEAADITDAEKLKEIMQKEKPQAVIHLAALTGIAKCNQNPSLAFSVNVLGTYNVIMGCLASRSRLIFISSREVYGETSSDRTREDSSLVPNNVYGLTKLLGEQLVLWAASRFGLKYTILRLTNVYGPEGDKINVQAMIKRALTDRRIRIFGGSQRMNLVYVTDVVEIIRRCLNEPRATDQVLNVGSEDDFTVDEVVAKVVACLKVPVEIEHGPMRPGETLNFRPNLQRSREILGYSPSTSFEEGLQKTVAWYKERFRDGTPRE